VLGPLDDQDFGESVAQFQAFCENTDPVSLCSRELALFDSFPVYIYTHKGEWITGTATQYGDIASLFIESDQQIQGGTSGSAIVNEAGEPPIFSRSRTD
jgi:hypothetical protein